MQLRQSYFVLATFVGGIFGAIVLGWGGASAQPSDGEKLAFA
jgi:hypothetical protein